MDPDGRPGVPRRLSGCNGHGAHFKEGFHKAGIDYPGHTEMLADLCGTKRFAMMLFGGALRIVLVTPIFRSQRLRRV